MRNELIAAVRGHLQHIRQDPALAVAPDVLADARRLEETLQDEGDLEARYWLGWLHAYRYAALPHGQDQDALEAAIILLTPGFLAGASPLPESLLPFLADASTPAATELLRQGLRSADPGLAARAARAWQCIAAATSPNHPARTGRLAILDGLLRAQSAYRGADGVDIAIGILQRGIVATPADHPDRAMFLFNLGLALYERFESTMSATDLDAAIDALKHAVEGDHDGRPARAEYLSYLGVFLRSRFDQTQDLADLDAAIEVSQRAVHEADEDHSDRAMKLWLLGIVWQERFERTQVLADLDAAIEVRQRAVHEANANHPQWAGMLANLAYSLRARFDRTQQLTDLDAVVQASERAAEAERLERAEAFSALGDVLEARFDRTQQLTDLHAAVEARQQAVDEAEANHPDRAVLVSDLALILRVRFEHTKQPADLNAAIRAFRQASADHHPQRAAVLSNLGDALRERFDQSQDLADLDAAIMAGQQALRAAGPGHPGRADLLSTLGIALQERFEHTNQSADLDDAIDAHQQAANEALADDPHRADRLNRFGNALRMRFMLAGTEADLSGTIRAIEQAVKATPVNGIRRAALLSDLCADLTRRFELIGATTDLQSAVEAGQQAVGTTPNDHPDRAGTLSNLAGALIARFRRLGAGEDLDACIGIIRQAAEITHGDDRAMYLSNLGDVLRTRFTHTRRWDEPTGTYVRADLADLDAAVAAGQEAAETFSADHPNRAGHLTNLGLALQLRFEHTQAASDLDAAIAAGQEAVNTTPTDHPDRAKFLSNLGLALWVRFEYTGIGREELLDVLASAVETPSGKPSTRIASAQLAAAIAATSDIARAADLLETAVRLLPQVAPRQLHRSDQQHALGGLANLASDAAALILNAPGLVGPRAARALRLLESGRVVMLSQVLETRGELTDLMERHPILAARFIELRDQLDTADPLLVPAVAPGATGDRRHESDRHYLAAQFAATVEEIRSRDGFASFMLPPEPQEIIAEAHQGPIAVLNASSYGSDALLVTRQGITHLPLPGLAPETLVEKINFFHEALAVAGDPRVTGFQRMGAQDDLLGILEWLWDTVAEPVLHALGFDEPHSTDAPRVWWIPCGMMGLLPVHAAGYHRKIASEPGNRTVMDRVVSSYTPTVRAVRHARRPIPTSPSAAQALIVAMPTTQDERPLPNAAAEAALLLAKLPHALPLIEPAIPQQAADTAQAALPTRTNVVAGIAKCALVHFACHGVSDPSDPSQSRLLLHDHATDPLTVASLAPIKFDQADLAYLSACSTTLTQNIDLLDEAIHLTSAFQLAGFRHVIGTQWEIEDARALEIVKAFYSALTESGTLDTSRSAHALHNAVRALRDAYWRTPSLWASHLHAGA